MYKRQVLGGAVVIAVGALGKQVGGPRAGIIAAAIAAIYPNLIAADGVLMSESLYGLFVALGLLAALRLREAGTTRPALALGLLLGLAALTRTEALGLLLALLVVLAVCMKDRRRVLVVTLAAALMLQVPWVVRNTVEFGHPALSHNEAVVLAGTNCAAVYSGRDIGWYGFLCAAGYRPKGTEAEAAARARSHGLDYARDHIGELPGVMAVRLLRVWGL